jgi:hypothetical protein
MAELSVAGCWLVPDTTNTFKTQNPTIASSLVRRHLVYICRHNFQSVSKQASTVITFSKIVDVGGRRSSQIRRQ